MKDTQLLDEGLCLSLPAALTGRLGLLLVRTGDEVATRGEAALQAIGISGRDYAALAVISHDKPSSQLELARLMGKAPALCVALLDELEGAGLVERVRDPKDRRRSIVSLTKAGDAKLAEADAVAREVEAGALDGLSDDEREHLGELLGRALTSARAVHT